MDSIKTRIVRLGANHTLCTNVQLKMLKDDWYLKLTDRVVKHTLHQIKCACVCASSLSSTFYERTWWKRFLPRNEGKKQRNQWHAHCAVWARKCMEKSSHYVNLCYSWIVSQQSKFTTIHLFGRASLCDANAIASWKKLIWKPWMICCCCHCLQWTWARHEQHKVRILWNTRNYYDIFGASLSSFCNEFISLFAHCKMHLIPGLRNEITFACAHTNCYWIGHVFGMWRNQVYQVLIFPSMVHSRSGQTDSCWLHNLFQFGSHHVQATTKLDGFRRMFDAQ